MDLSLTYKLMCQKATELQSVWKPTMGDWFILKASHCGESNGCSEDSPCEDCLEMDNEFVISGDHYNKYFFFNGMLCNRDGGNRLDSTTSSFLVTEDYENDVNGYHSKISECVWLPTQSQLQLLARKYMRSDYHFSWFPNNDGLSVLVHNWADDSSAYRVDYIGENSEQAWIQIYMKELHNKAWHEDKRQWIDCIGVNRYGYLNYDLGYELR